MTGTAGNLSGPVVAFCAAHVLPSAYATPRHDAAVLVQDGLIVDVIDRHRVPTGVQRVDTDAPWLGPGLIDTHVHLAWDGGPAPNDVLAAQTEDDVAAACARHARDHLVNGVTTVRDLGGPHRIVFAVRDAINAGATTGAAVGARILAAGGIVARTTGRGSLKIATSGAADVERTVTGLLHAGADVIKLAATGGVFTPGDGIGAIELTPRELALATRLAHDAGRPVATHAYTPTGIRHAVTAGTDTIEHASFLDAGTAARVADHGQTIVPTITAFACYVDAPTHLSLPTAAVRKAARALEAGKAALAYALARSIPIAAGSDAGGRAKPHGCLADELGHLVEAGMSPTAAYAAATSTAARACGITNAGELRPGTRADIIGTDHNPAVQVGTLHHVRTVIAAGRVIT